MKVVKVQNSFQFDEFFTKIFRIRICRFWDFPDFPNKVFIQKLYGHTVSMICVCILIIGFQVLKQFCLQIWKAE